MTRKPPNCILFSTYLLKLICATYLKKNHKKVGTRYYYSSKLFRLFTDLFIIVVIEYNIISMLLSFQKIFELFCGFIIVIITYTCYIPTDIGRQMIDKWYEGNKKLYFIYLCIINSILKICCLKPWIQGLMYCYPIQFPRGVLQPGGYGRN